MDEALSPGPLLRSPLCSEIAMRGTVLLVWIQVRIKLGLSGLDNIHCSKAVVKCVACQLSNGHRVE